MFQVSLKTVFFIIKTCFLKIRGTQFSGILVDFSVALLEFLHQRYRKKCYHYSPADSTAMSTTTAMVDTNQFAIMFNARACYNIGLKLFCQRNEYRYRLPKTLIILVLFKNVKINLTEGLWVFSSWILTRDHSGVTVQSGVTTYELISLHQLPSIFFLAFSLRGKTNWSMWFDSTQLAFTS